MRASKCNVLINVIFDHTVFTRSGEEARCHDKALDKQRKEDRCLRQRWEETRERWRFRDGGLPYVHEIKREGVCRRTSTTVQDQTCENDEQDRITQLLRRAHSLVTNFFCAL